MTPPDHHFTDRALLEVLALSDDPTTVFTSEELHIGFVNDAMLKFFGKDRSIIGKTLAEGVPELIGQPFIDLLKEVWRTGKTYNATDTPAQLEINGVLTTSYFDFEYRAIPDASGKTYCILHRSIDVTARVKAAALIKDKEEKEKALAQKLAVSNDGLTMANEALKKSMEQQVTINEQLASRNEKLLVIEEELVGLNRQLDENQDQLQIANRQLREKEENLRLTVEAAKLGVYSLDITSGIVTINEYCREIFGFPPDSIVTLADGFNTMEEDAPRIEKAMRESIESENLFDQEFRIIRKLDGKLRWVRSVGRALKRDDGQKTTFYGTIADITQRKAEEQRRNDFIGIVSHELRTPLTSLSGYIQVLEMNQSIAADKSASDIMSRAIRQVDRMTSLIGDFLDVARAGEGKIELKKTKFDILDVIETVRNETAVTVTSHELVYEPLMPAIVEADAAKIEQVLANLVGNAVKYSANGSRICVSAVVENKQIRVSVQDEGIGLTPEDLPQVFDRFFRANNEKTRFVKGFGIGLYISKEIIEQHGGTIGATSEADQGSVFWFSLPLAEG
jgi:two-component system sensor histidine kinase VicK